MPEPPADANFLDSIVPARVVDQTTASDASVPAVARLEPDNALTADWSRTLPTVTSADAYALLGAIAAHALAIQLAFAPASYMRLGALGSLDEAIEIDVVDEEGLLRSASSRIRAEAAREAASALQAGEQATVESIAATSGAAKPGEVPEQKAAVTSETAAVVPEPEQDRSLPAAQADAKPAERPDGTSPGAVAAAPAALEGGAIASSNLAGDADEGRSAAAAGERQRYAVEVIRSLARNPPRGARTAGGAVHVDFIIDATGRVKDAWVAKSSGDSKLDEIALSTVRATLFPAPPASMSDSERRYKIPYTFR
jgi:protein TonB